MFDPATYRSMQGSIRPSPELVSRAVRSARPRRTVMLRRVLAAAAALALCICVPALAGPSVFYQLVYTVSPDFAQHFAPVQMSCESNGIRLEVVSARIHGSTAEIYLTLQDLTGDRVDETTDLYDSYSIHRAFSCSATCQRVGFDSQTGTAAFLIRVDEWGGQNIEGSKMTFSFDRFLSHKTVQQVELPLELTALPAGSAMQEVTERGRSYADERLADEPSRALVPSDEPLFIPAEGFAVTAAGMADGMLRVQVRADDVMRLDNHANLYLLDSSGGRVSCDFSISFYHGPHDGPDRVDYTEFVFDVPQDELGQYTLYGDFTASGMLTEGDWSVTFPLENAR